MSRAYLIPRVFSDRLRDIRAFVQPKQPLILVITVNDLEARFYTEQAFGRVAVLPITNLRFTDSLDFNAIANDNASPERNWAQAAIASSSDFCLKQSKAEQKFNNTANALQWAERAVELNAGDVSAHYHLSGLQLATGDLESAKSSIEKAIALSPYEAVFVRRLSEIQLRAGDSGSAMESAKFALRIDGLDPYNFHHLARVQMAIPDYDLAEKAERQALKIDPNNPLFHRRVEDIRLKRGS